jgi:Bacterial extracellular solute-binding proteins, family 5 Middle
LASRWLDPIDTEAFINQFMVLYAIHDALVKPMPAGDNTPSLSESWTMSEDGLTYAFVLRKDARFHNGDPVTAEDAKFSFERYRGAASKLLKERVRVRRRRSAGGLRVRPQSEPHQPDRDRSRAPVRPVRGTPASRLRHRPGDLLRALSGASTSPPSVRVVTRARWAPRAWRARPVPRAVTPEPATRLASPREIARVPVASILGMPPG